MIHISELRKLPKEVQEEFLNSLTKDELLQYQYDWTMHARPKQLLPKGGWNTALIMAGRGFGKTRLGAEWIIQKKNEGAMRIGVIAPTTSDIIKVVVDGESGVLKSSPPWDVPKFNQTRLELTWKNGAKLLCFSAEKPERLRGPQFSKVWFDEIATCSKADEVYDMAMMGLRLESLDGSPPQMLITTTPQDIPIVGELHDSAVNGDKDKSGNLKVLMVNGSTRENAQNLDDRYLETMSDRYDNTRLGEQEIEGKLLRQVDGALWTAEMLENCVFKGEDKEKQDIIKSLVRIVVGVDPSGSSGKKGDYQGIVVCGVDEVGNYWVIEDGSVSETPTGWARRCINLYKKYDADKIVAEKNFGGEMVRSNIHTVDSDAPVKIIHASKAKHVRAEPIANLYEQGKVRHLKYFKQLDEELSKMTYQGYKGRGSPDRLDAMVWAMTELIKRKKTKMSFKLSGKI